MTTEPASPQVRCRGIRGATFATDDTQEAILSATRELLAALVAANGIATEDVASAFFTTTLDLRAAFPAVLSFLKRRLPGTANCGASGKPSPQPSPLD